MPTSTFSAYAVWKAAKDQLLTETHGKCAYCETSTNVVDYGDVEHFRPKSRYWWLAYCYDNYLASCAICNQKFKSNDFFLRSGYTRLKGIDIAKTATDAQLELIAPTLTVDPINELEGMPYQQFIDDLHIEWALLVHPYFEEPSDYYAYKAIPETKEVFVVPANEDCTDVIDAAEQLFGINRKELLDLRFQWYCLYMTYRHTLNDPGISAGTRAMNQQRLNELLTGRQAYTGMIKYFETKALADLPWKFDLIV